MAAEERNGPGRAWWLAAGLAVVVVAALAWGALAGQRSGSTGERAASAQDSAMDQRLKSLQRRQPGDPLALGRTDAPVVLIKYEDFRCPYCSKFTTDVEPRLIERYVRTGVLRIEWRDFPIFGRESVEVAKAARAAGRQDKFWEFHDLAYAMGDGTNKVGFPEQRIQEMAREAGVPDLAKFNADRADPAIMRSIQADRTEGQQLGVSSTPAFVLNTEPILGAQPLEQFASVIEAERAKT